MSELIKNGQSVSDAWKIVTLAEWETPHRVKLPVGPLLVPLSVWRARRAELIQREYEHGWPLGVWLASNESAAAIAHDIDDFSVIALELEGNGENFSLANARLLRERYGYRDELRAIGNVSRSQAGQLSQAGFNAFAVSEGKREDKGVWNGLVEWFNYDAAAAPAHLGNAAA